MPGNTRPEKCKRCGATNTTISFRGLCRDCSTMAFADNLLQMKMKQGPNYEKWKEGFKKMLDERD